MVRVALVGCGRWGERYLRILPSVPHLQLVAVCDSDPEVLARVKFGYPRLDGYSNVAECFEHLAVDAVILATPANTHHALAYNVLEAKKHVLVEKPVCDNLMEARELVALAQRQERVLMAGHLLEYHPATAWVRSYVQKRSLPSYVRGIRCANPLPAAGSVILDLLVHDLARLRYMLDLEPRELLATGNSHQTVSVIIRCLDGIQVYLTASWMEVEVRRQMELFWPGTMVRMDDLSQDGVCVVTQEADRLVKSYQTKPGDALYEQCRHFVQCIRTQFPPRTGPEDILWVTTALTLAQASLERRGQWVLWSGGCY